MKHKHIFIGILITFLLCGCSKPSTPSPLPPPDKQAVVLRENSGGELIELASAYPHGYFQSFFILRQGDRYYLWLNSIYYNDSQRDAKTQRFESTDGLLWSQRTDTNLVREHVSYEFVFGPRQIIFDDGYEGWEEYYYTESFGWARGIRYITSGDGLHWEVVNEPALIGAKYPSVAKVDGRYHLWASPDGDNNPNVGGGYQGIEAIRYRTSAAGGSDWGNWETGGVWVTIDGGEKVKSLNRVRRLVDGTYQLFYLRDSVLYLATGTDGVQFSTQPQALIDLAKAFPGYAYPNDFCIAEIGNADWLYVTYRDADKVPHIAAVSLTDRQTLPQR